MNARLVVRPRADADLDQCVEYLAERNIRAARRFLEAAQQTFERIAEMPDLGARFQFLELDQPSPLLAELRVVPIKRFRKYLVFYRAIRGGAEIVRVLHGARDIDESLF